MDTLSPAARSARMARVRSRDSRPEMLVRRLVHAMGFRYRLHDRRLPGAPDLVFRSRRKAIFVHGCFWHRHPDSTCKLARLPKSRLDFWGPKLQSNRERDLRQQVELKTLGWDFLVVWECELRNRVELAERLRRFITEMPSELCAH